MNETPHESRNGWSAAGASRLLAMLVLAGGTVVACQADTPSEPVSGIARPALLSVRSPGTPRKAKRQTPDIRNIGTCYVMEGRATVGADGLAYSIDSVKLSGARDYRLGTTGSAGFDTASVARFAFIKWGNGRHTTKKVNCVIPKTEAAVAELYALFVPASYEVVKRDLADRAARRAKGEAAPGQDEVPEPILGEAGSNSAQLGDGGTNASEDQGSPLILSPSDLGEPSDDATSDLPGEAVAEAPSVFASNATASAPIAAIAARGQEGWCTWDYGNEETLYCDGMVCHWDDWAENWDCGTDWDGNECTLDTTPLGGLQLTCVVDCDPGFYYDEWSQTCQPDEEEEEEEEPPPPPPPPSEPPIGHENWEACLPGVPGPGDTLCYRAPTQQEKTLMLNAVTQYKVRTSFPSDSTRIKCEMARLMFTDRLNRGLIKVGKKQSVAPEPIHAAGTDSLAVVHIDPLYLRDAAVPEPQVTQLGYREEVAISLLHEMFHVMAHQHPGETGDPYTSWPFNLTNDHRANRAAANPASCVQW